MHMLSALGKIMARYWT